MREYMRGYVDIAITYEGLCADMRGLRVLSIFYVNFLTVLKFDLLQLQILVNRKDGGNMMNENDIEELMTMHRFVINNITISDGNNFLSYHDICGIYCNDSNNIVLSFIQVCCH